MAVTRLAEASGLLESLGKSLKGDFTWQEKRELVELLVGEVTVNTVGEASARRIETTVTYMLYGSVNSRTDMGLCLH